MGSVVKAAVDCGKAGALQRAVYHVVTNDETKNLRDCVRRIDGAVREKGCGGTKLLGRYYREWVQRYERMRPVGGLGNLHLFTMTAECLSKGIALPALLVSWGKGISHRG